MKAAFIDCARCDRVLNPPLVQSGICFMRAEAQAYATSIQQALDLLRRFL
jgi:hypothetical protein